MFIIVYWMLKKNAGGIISIPSIVTNDENRISRRFVKRYIIRLCDIWGARSEADAGAERQLQCDVA